MPPLWNTPQGRDTVKTILAFLGITPHDYQLDGILVSLDGESLLATMATGSGKTGFFSFLMLVVLAVSISPGLMPAGGKPFPENPAMVIVMPTMALQYDMQRQLQGVGLATAVINSETTREVKVGSRVVVPSLWKECETKNTMILMSPEMLTTPRCRRLLDNQAFKNRCVYLGVDEAHLIVNWGDFRDSYNQIGHMRARFPTRPDGSYIPIVLGLEAGSYHLLRRSNLRPDIQVTVREFSQETSLSGVSFPDLDWVLTSGRTTVIFCKTINLGFRVASYFWRQARAKGMEEMQSKIRLFNSLNAPLVNKETLGFINDNKDATIVIATDVLSVGWDSPAVSDAIVLGVPLDLDELVQKWGRVGRDVTRVKDPRAYLYCPKGTFSLAQKVIDENTSGAKGKSASTQMGLSIAQFIRAECKTENLNIQYNNPVVDAPCLCPRCEARPRPDTSQCLCNGPRCKPESDAPSGLETTPKGPAKARARPGEGISKAMSQLGHLKFLAVQTEIFNAEQEHNLMLPPYYYLPDPVISGLVKAVYSIESMDDVVTYLDNSRANPRQVLLKYKERLFTCCQELLSLFSEIRAQEKVARASKKAAKQVATVGTAGGEGVEADEQDSDMELLRLWRRA
ncbi:P-loop containing nucleoside triphosphate hydrolase protein [Coprinellus micaceus]|uniref:DNA 3'-5' helicase n=1 Tax=Coprinellus micaceus TaxID=71717 RepID=A0A4Y7SKH9_COPMI|nr:P-loop containing nucleoside triphosphate hydrolase protein [Coprinellus micaceus]